VARREPFVTSPALGIADLVHVCGRERARSALLFERIGGWVADTDHPALQQVFAVGAHRHAWHAGLWSDRLPAVPSADDATWEPPAELAAALDAAGTTDERRAAYEAALDAAQIELAIIRRRADPLLDPTTVRVTDLVGSDIVDLAARLATSR
jgi:hypothetical protein